MQCDCNTVFYPLKVIVFGDTAGVFLFWEVLPLQLRNVKMILIVTAISEAGLFIRGCQHHCCWDISHQLCTHTHTHTYSQHIQTDTRTAQIVPPVTFEKHSCWFDSTKEALWKHKRENPPKCSSLEDPTPLEQTIEATFNQQVNKMTTFYAEIYESILWNDWEGANWAWSPLTLPLLITARCPGLSFRTSRQNSCWVRIKSTSSVLNFFSKASPSMP